MDIESVTISDELQQYLQDLKSSSGAGASAMLRGANDRPKGLDAAMVNRWLSGKTRTARSDHWNYVIKRWSEYLKFAAYLVVNHEETLRWVLEADDARREAKKAAWLAPAVATE